MFDYLTRSQVLDPRISYEGLKSDFYHNEDLLQELETAKTALDNHFKANYAARNHNIVPVTPPLTASSSCELGSPQKDFTARYQVHRRVVLDELREYYSLPREDFKHCDPVQWWFVRKAQFPNLFCLARNILTIPGTSFFCSSLREALIIPTGSAVAVERIFSSGCDTISLRRASLKPDTTAPL
jgi:hypothetical protein